MHLGNIKRYKSWLTSAAIALVIALWLASGQISSDESVTALDSSRSVTNTELRTSVRIRQQAAEQVTRTIAVNGRTAPARVVALNAETDGRVTMVGVERGERLNKGDVIVELDERDRRARTSTCTLWACCSGTASSRCPSSCAAWPCPPTSPPIGPWRLKSPPS